MDHRSPRPRSAGWAAGSWWQEEQVAQSEVASELVANVLSVDVEVGQQVREGDALVILESMKMEIPVLAPHDGVVAEVRTAAGDVVQDGDVMVVIKG
jgi:biotin carboxyl carrier protein